MERIMNEGVMPEDTAEIQEVEAVKSEDNQGEDLLLAEIDAFRSKAAQLQMLINAKETKAAELEALVAEKETENKELQVELTKKHEEADGIVADVQTQVDRMLQLLRTEMVQLEEDIKAQVDNNHETYMTNSAHLENSIAEMNQKLESMQSELAEKTHSESVHLYRLIQDAFKENDRSEELNRRSEAHYKALKNFSTVLAIITSLSLCATVAVLLKLFGII